MADDKDVGTSSNDIRPAASVGALRIRDGRHVSGSPRGRHRTPIYSSSSEDDFDVSDIDESLPEEERKQLRKAKIKMKIKEKAEKKAQKLFKKKMKDERSRSLSVGHHAVPHPYETQAYSHSQYQFPSDPSLAL